MSNIFEDYENGTLDHKEEKRSSSEYTMLLINNGFDSVKIDIVDYANDVKILPLVLRKRLLYSQKVCI